MSNQSIHRSRSNNRKNGQLLPGDHLRIIAPASSAKEWDGLGAATAAFRDAGFTVSFGKHYRKKNEYLAGTDGERLEDLHAAFRDSSVDGILCLRGGYGTPRLLSMIDYDLARKYRKPVCGFSDITALQLALYRKSGIVSHSSPTFLSFLSKREEGNIFQTNEFNFNSFLSVVYSSGKQKVDVLDLPAQYLQSMKILYSNPAVEEGILLGGNLSLICSLIGTPYIPSFADKILFFEEVKEAPYRFDRLLTQLLLSNVLKNVKAILFGQCEGCPNWEAIVAARLKGLETPLITGLPFGHINDIITLPQGRKVKLISAEKKVSLFI